MIKIAPLRPDQISEAKQVISDVARRIYAPEQVSQEWEQTLAYEHELDDVDNFEQVYAESRGLFLVAMDDDRVVGTGALRPLEFETAELKRMWLLEEYHGQGIGYRILMQLFEFARKHDYKRICLQTGQIQKRALAFYHRIGFVEIPTFNDNQDGDEISMEIRL